MYLWTAINVDDQLADLRRQSEAAARALGLPDAPFTLPLHVSLRISFPADDAAAPAILEDIRAYYRTLRPFAMQVSGVEDTGDIVWLRMKESEKLSAIHAHLCDTLAARYGVPPHPFDARFIFHATLLMTNAPGQSARGFEMLKNKPVPATLRADRFIIGASPSGAIGSYHVLEEIAALFTP